jgi:rhodanese-related sulfurtransferase
MSTVPQVSPAQLATDPPGALVVNIGQPDEVASGRIAGSVNIPIGQLRRRRLVDLDEHGPRPRRVPERPHENARHSGSS